MDLQMVKQYLRIDTDADDQLLGIMMEAAEQYIVDAAGKYDREDYKAGMLFLAIVQDLYENRSTSLSENGKRRLARTQASILLQLQCKEVPDG